MYELNDRVRELGERVIGKYAEAFSALTDQERPCRIAYMYSDEKKRSSGRIVYADTYRPNEQMRALSGYDFVITFYGYACDELPDNVLETLMLHELMHIGYNPTLHRREIIPHDVEDFEYIIRAYGLDWVHGGEKGDAAQ